MKYTFVFFIKTNANSGLCGACVLSRYRWEYWYGRWEPPGNDGRVTIRSGVGTLIFAHTIAKDEGVYQCIAENTAGVAVSKIALLQMAGKSWDSIVLQ